MAVRRKRLLIVDDQYGIRMLLKEVFRRENYVTFEVDNGRAAIDIVQRERPHLVLLDMKIPGMDGIQILKRMKQVEPDVRVIMMTAYGELEMIKEAASLGALSYFTKPFDIDELCQVVNKQLQN